MKDSEHPDLPSHPIFLKLIRTMFWHTDFTRKKSVDETIVGATRLQSFVQTETIVPLPLPLPLFPQVQASCSAACTWWKKGKGEGKGHGWGTMATIETRKTRWETGKFWAAFTHPISFKTDKDHVLAHRIHKKRV